MEREYQAQAKINLALEILGRRPDAYHEIRSILQTLALHDSLYVETACDLSLTVEADEGASLGGLAAEDNLALKAARLLRAEARVNEGAALRLHKRIPAAAGLGGGSSDAAAALRALDDLWGLRWPPERLATVAATLGADVSFFLTPGTALVSGRGHLVEPLPLLDGLWAILVIPALSLRNKTRWAYSQLAPHHWSSGAMTLDLAAQVRNGQPSLAGVHRRNTFEPVVTSQVPAVRYCRHTMWQEGVRGVCLSGAGPTLFALVVDEAEAMAACARLRRALGEAATVILTRTSPGPRPANGADRPE